MSEQNVEVVRRIFPAEVELVGVFGSADLLGAMRAGIEPFVEPGFETIGDPNAIPMGSEIGVEGDRPDLFAKGLDGFLDFWREWLSAWESWTVGSPEFIDVDESRVLVNQQVRAVSKTDQVEISIEAGNLMTLRDGKLTRMELFFNRDEALEAAGLSRRA